MVGQGDELVVTRNLAEAPRQPIQLGLLDPLLRRRHEVPPQVAAAIQRLAPEQHGLQRCFRAQHVARAAVEYDQVLRGKIRAIELRRRIQSLTINV